MPCTLFASKIAHFNILCMNGVHGSIYAGVNWSDSNLDMHSFSMLCQRGDSVRKCLIMDWVMVGCQNQASFQAVRTCSMYGNNTAGNCLLCRRGSPVPPPAMARQSLVTNLKQHGQTWQNFLWSLRIDDGSSCLLRCSLGERELIICPPYAVQNPGSYSVLASVMEWALLPGA